MSDMVMPGTRIVAVGADAPGKCELEPSLFERAAVVVVDSRQQCIEHGEIQHAFAEKRLDEAKMVELGTFASNDRSHRQRRIASSTIRRGDGLRW